MWTALHVQATCCDERSADINVGGLLFGDLYHLPGHHLESGDGATGLVVRRGYLTFDKIFSEKLFGRLRFELNQSGEFETYTFDLDFKDLYLGWRLGEHTLLAGLSPTPTFDLVESRWGLRYLMRTPMDLQGMPSRETGFSLSGPLNANGSLAYRVMLGTRYEFGAESSEFPRYMAALHWKPAEGWDVDFYLDHERGKSNEDSQTLQLFIAQQREKFRWGILLSHVELDTQQSNHLYSAYSVYDISDRSSLVGRIDRISEPSPRGDNISYIPFDPTAPATLFLAGYEYRIGPDLTLTPNFIVIDYDRNDEGEIPETDIYLRLTAFWRF